MLSCCLVQIGLPFIEPPDFYFVRHPRARRYLLRVDGDGRVRVTIPRGGSRREAGAFAERNREWVERQRARLPVAIVSEQERSALRARAAIELPMLLRRKAAELRLVVSRVTVRNQRSRWGSCGHHGHIALNWRLVAMPPWIRDYVIVHELMHLRRMDHSPAFWALVEAEYPDYREARAWLKANSALLR
jgi:predicted metal-dependent hydrolase